MSVRMTSSFEFSGAPPPGNRRAGNYVGGFVGLAKSSVSVTEGRSVRKPSFGTPVASGGRYRPAGEDSMRMFGPEPLFRDRRDSGRALAARLERYRGRARTLTAKSLSKSSTGGSSMGADFEKPAIAARMCSPAPTPAPTRRARFVA